MREDSSSGARSKGASKRPAYLRGGLWSRQEPSGSPAPESQTEKAGLPKTETQDEVLLTWRVWLLSRNIPKSVLVMVSTAAMIFLAYWAIPQLLFVGFITLLILNRLAPYLFPMKYELREKTVSYKTYMASNTKRWDELFCYREYPDGIMLMHDPRTITGRVREGIFLYYDESPGHKDEILRIVSSKLRPLKEAVAARADGDGVSPKGGLFSAISRLRRLRKARPEDRRE